MNGIILGLGLAIVGLIVKYLHSQHGPDRK